MSFMNSWAYHTEEQWKSEGRTQHLKRSTHICLDQNNESSICQWSTRPDDGRTITHGASRDPLPQRNVDIQIPMCMNQCDMYCSEYLQDQNNESSICRWSTHADPDGRTITPGASRDPLPQWNVDIKIPMCMNQYDMHCSEYLHLFKPNLFNWWMKHLRGCAKMVGP
jgi:hypothetical protein